MKEKDKKTLLVGAGAVALLGLAVYASRGAGAEPLNLGGGGGVAGGGMPAVFAGGVDGNGEGTGQAEVTYNVAFPDVQVPAMPSPPNYRSDSGTQSKKGNRITETVTMSTGQTQEVAIKASPTGFFEVAAGTTWKGDDAGYTAGATPAGATPAGDVSGIPGGSSTKKGAAVGRDTAPGGLPGLVGDLLGGIGNLFGW